MSGVEWTDEENRVHEASQLAAGDRVSFLWCGEPMETTLYRRGDRLMAINPDALRYGDDEPSDITLVLQGGSINPNATHITAQRAATDELRAALAPQNHPRSAPEAPEAPGQPGRGERGSGGRTAALAQVLFEWNTPTDPYFVIKGRAGDVDERDPYIPIVEALLADPGPLLAALAEAGALTEQRNGIDSLLPPARRYVSEWRPDARP